MFGIVKLIIKESKQSGGGLGWTEYNESFNLGDTQLKYKMMKEIDSETCDLVIDRKDYNKVNNVLQKSINNLAASKFKEVKTKKMQTIESKKESKINKNKKDYERDLKKIENDFKQNTKYELNAANNLLKKAHTDFDTSGTFPRNISQVDQFNKVDAMLDLFKNHINSMEHKVIVPKNDSELKVKGWFGSTTKTQLMTTNNLEKWITSEISSHVNDRQTRIDEANALLTRRNNEAEKEYAEKKKVIDDTAMYELQKIIANASIKLENTPAIFTQRGNNKLVAATGSFKARLKYIDYGLDNNNVHLEYYYTNKWIPITLSLEQVCLKNKNENEDE
jgi:hypothetical protein